MAVAQPLAHRSVPNRLSPLDIAEDNSEDRYSFGWIQRRLVASCSTPPLLFVGESPSRALPLALAVMRGSLDGLWATSIDDVEARSIHMLLEEIKGRMRYRDSIADKFSWTLYNRFEQHVVHDIDNEYNSRFLQSLFLQADATKLQDFFDSGFDRNIQFPTANIWFQCPWVLNGDTNGLMKDFISSASKIQQYGDAIFLGLTSHPRYRDRYKLEESKFWKYARKCGYERCVLQGSQTGRREAQVFEDSRFIRECIKFGYRHSSDGMDNIHSYIRDYHVTYALIKLKRFGGDSLPKHLLKLILNLALFPDDIRLHNQTVPGAFENNGDVAEFRPGRPVATYSSLLRVSKRWRSIAKCLRGNLDWVGQKRVRKDCDADRPGRREAHPNHPGLIHIESYAVIIIYTGASFISLLFSMLLNYLR